MKNVLFCAFMVLSILTFGHSTGPMFTHGIASTGAPGETTCGSCHSGGNLGGDIMFTDLSSRNLFQDGYYSPGQQYFISAYIISSAPFPEGGIQFRAVDSSGAPAGWFLPGNTSNSSIAPIRLQYRNGYWRQFVEHPQPITPNYANGSWRIQIISAWTAPAFSDKPITFYGAGTTVNSNDSASGDNSFFTSVTVYRSPVLNYDQTPPIFNDRRIVTDLAIVKPVSFNDNILGFGYYSYGGEHLRYRIYDASGKLVKRGSEDIPDGEGRIRIRIDGISRGVYHVKFITSRGGVSIHKVFK